MNVQVFLRVLHKDIQKKSLLKHPFYRLWHQGKLSPAALHLYACQYYHFTDHFPRFVAAIYQHCTEAAVRRRILENLTEEEIGGGRHPVPHAEQWLAFCRALGLKRAAVLGGEKSRATSALLRTLARLTAKDFLGGVAAVLAYEQQVPAIARTKKQGLQKHYGITTRQGLIFFDTHMRADRAHAKTWTDILTQYATSARVQHQVRKSVQMSLHAQWKMLSDVLEHARSRLC